MAIALGMTGLPARPEQVGAPPAANAEQQTNRNAGIALVETGNAARQAEKTLTAQAIKPTPATASATKTDMRTQLVPEPKAPEEREIPITGPDELAKLLGEEVRKARDAQAAEQQERELRQAAEAEVAKIEQQAAVAQRKVEASPAPGTNADIEAQKSRDVAPSPVMEAAKAADKAYTAAKESSDAANRVAAMKESVSIVRGEFDGGLKAA